MEEITIEKTKQFVKDHKAELLIAGISVVVIAGVLIVTRGQMTDMRKMIALKNMHINELEKVCEAQTMRINQLEQLCENKDNVFKAVISDSLKHGSSEAGRHMAERKAFLHRMAS